MIVKLPLNTNLDVEMSTLSQLNSTKIIWVKQLDSLLEDLWETKVERLDELDSKVKLNFFSSPSSKSQSPKSQSQDQKDLNMGHQPYML